MKKKLVCAILIFALCLSTSISSFAAETYSNFTLKNNYTNQFTDVNTSNWFYTFVKQSYEYGLLLGRSESSFGPNENLSIAETITLAARLHSIYTTGSDLKSSVPTGGNWYDPYVEYALTNKIISTPYSDYHVYAVRSEVAVIFANALPDEAFASIRTVNDNAIPDVPASASYAAAVYQLYRAGILSGSDSKGTFHPNSNITRSEIAAICVMIADPSKRSTAAIGGTLDSGEKLTAMQISEKCSPAVFYVQIYSFNGALRGSGSGFFISSDGLAITNHHVAANSSYLEVITQDGKSYHDVEIIDMDEENDLALLRVKGTDFPYLELGDSSELKQGQQVYAIGSPRGLDNTMSQGIISNPNRALGNGTFVQISVPITYGSSGGALIDEYGKAVGVTSGGFSDVNADLNLAIPINQVKKLDRNSVESYFTWSSEYYTYCYQALDFGAFSGVELLDIGVTKYGFIYTYDAFDFHNVFDLPNYTNFANTLYYYNKALLAEGFQHTKVVEGFEGVYESSTEMVEVETDLNAGTITVLVERKPQYYAEFPKLPDFGWLACIDMYSEPTWVENSFMYSYKYSNYFSDSSFETYLLWYFDILEDQNFTYIGSDDNNTSYLFAGNDITVVYVIADGMLYIDVQPL